MSVESVKTHAYDEETLKKPKDNRKRNIACIVYPESAPADWLIKLAELKIPCLVSPLHDRDINPDGTIKKPHYHVLMCFEGKKSNDQINEMKATFGGVGTEVVQSIRGYTRYLCHLDNPEKAQYPISGIRSFGGADFETYCTLPSDVSKEIKLMQKFIRKYGIHSFSDFLDICAESFPDWHYLLVTRCTSILKEYLKSIEYDRKESLKNGGKEY